MEPAWLVVGTLEPGAFLGSVPLRAPPFRWFEAPPWIDLEPLARFLCEQLGEDPSAPVVPREERTNPFTRETFVRTHLDRAVEAFEMEDGPSWDHVIVHRFPRPFVAWLASSSIAVLAPIAKLAVAERADMFLWAFAD